MIIDTTPRETLIPLCKLKKSPRNARTTPHSMAAIEATAASIAAKGILQNLVVEPERDEQGEPTGYYLVTIGEGRRLAQLLRVKRKQIKKSEPIRCIVDTTNDPHEISLDENVTREAMHPADQFEAFRTLAERNGWSAQDIAARFGVSAHTVRQRLRLGAVSPRLMQAYRDEELNLDELMSFALVSDMQRQEQVFDSLGHNRNAYSIRRELTRTHVEASDPRARFVGSIAYEAAGGTLLRDLFSDNDSCYFEDAALLDRLAADKLAEAAETLQSEGWKWVDVHLAYPHGHGLRRCQSQLAELSERDEETYAAAQYEYEQLAEGEDAPDEDRMAQLQATMQRLDAARTRYSGDDIARGGAFLCLNHDGTLRIERGLLRPGDMPEEQLPEEDAEEPREPAATLPDSLARDLHARRTLAMRWALGEQPDVALTALTHAMAAQTFYAYASAACLELRPQSATLGGFAKGLDESPEAQAVRHRHDAWAVGMPEDASQLWNYVSGLDAVQMMSLLAHCSSLTVAMVMPADGKRHAVQASGHLAAALKLDMAQHWSPTAESYFARIPKAKVIEAVAEAVSPEAAGRLGGMKKAQLVASAEQLMAGTGWLPAPLRSAQAA